MERPADQRAKPRRGDDAAFGLDSDRLIADLPSGSVYGSTPGPQLDLSTKRVAELGGKDAVQLAMISRHARSP